MIKPRSALASMLAVLATASAAAVYGLTHHDLAALRTGLLLAFISSIGLAFVWRKIVSPRLVNYQLTDGAIVCGKRGSISLDTVARAQKLTSAELREMEIKLGLLPYKLVIFERPKFFEAWAEFSMTTSRYSTATVIFLDTWLAGYRSLPFSSLRRWWYRVFYNEPTGEFVLVTSKDGSQHILSPLDVDRFISEIKGAIGREGRR